MYFANLRGNDGIEPAFMFLEKEKKVSKKLLVTLSIILLIGLGALVGLDFLTGDGENFWAFVMMVWSVDLAWIMAWLDKYSRLLEVGLTLIIIPIVTKTLRHNQEQGKMIRKKLDETTGVVVYGLFDGKLQSDYLGGIKTALFGEWLFDLIVGWNDKPSPNLITPPESFQADFMREIMAANASPFILQSRRIDCYFAGAKQHGTKNYPFARLILGLARPDADKLISQDYPRIMIVEEGHLRSIVDAETIQPQYDTPEGQTWLRTVRELGEAHFGGRDNGIAILEIPLL